MTSAIQVENLSKMFRIGCGPCEGGGDLRETISRWLVAPWAGLRSSLSNRSSTKEFWALRDISFQIDEGEVVGVIGRNGAGKSTLLKVLSRIAEPTNGRVRIRGRVASLLEVGTGFHPELTGRENIFLNGAILGMSRREIARKLDEIIDFSGVEEFLDTPVKRYSSGMRVRLGFAVAAHLEPDILIVDEVLAVGDAAFQKKCVGKMKGVANQGHAVLFVSHNMQAVSTLTDRCILLEAGQCLADGTTSQIIQAYLGLVGNEEAEYVAPPYSDKPNITCVTVTTSEAGQVHRHGQPLKVRFEIQTPEPLDGASLSFQVTDEYGRPVLHLWTFDSERPLGRAPGIYYATCDIPKCRLYLGHYSLTVHFTERPGGRRFERLEGICPFEVVMYSIDREFKWQPGTCVYLDDCEWQVNSADKRSN